MVAKKFGTKTKLVLFILTILYLLLLVILLNQPEQCPDNYSQSQVDESNCIVGAPIGLPFVLALTTFTWLISVMIVLIFSYKSIKK